MADEQFDRTAQDLGNIVNLGHVNVRISDQHLATHYYVSGLGLTRDPFLNTGARLMWVNAGMAQFHLPTGEPDVLRGVIGLVVPDHAALLDRLAQVREPLAGTRFEFRERNDCVETVCPWGNRIDVHAPDADRFGRIVLGMPYIAFDVRPGTAERIARFYREVMGALAAVIDDGGARRARVQVGEKQHWYFRETDAPERPCDRHRRSGRRGRGVRRVRSGRAVGQSASACVPDTRRAMGSGIDIRERRHQRRAHRARSQGRPG